VPPLSKRDVVMDNTEEIVNFVAAENVAGQKRNEPVSVQVTDTMLIVGTRDGRIIHTPLAWFPFLVNADREQRQNFRVVGSTILWEALDDGVSMETILLGDPDQ
jgi:hypothetical protein